MGVTVRVTRNFAGWEKGFRSMPRDVRVAATASLGRATRAMYDASQEYAHVVTGEMKRSGHTRVSAGYATVEAAVQYDSMHAVYEEERGGDHAFLTRAWAATEGEFRRAMPDAVRAVFERWM